VILHASSLVADGRAYLFLGHSGAGKSTTAMHAVAAGARVLSDDRTIVVREADGSFSAWGTPWHGSFRRASNRSAPVAGLFVIVQAAADAVTAIGAPRALGEAFVRLVHPTSSTREVEATVDTLERLVAALPVGELRQRPTPAGFALARAFADRVDRGAT
jgi:energy-coupling factor transporter ATP-binding protein EcfA2